MVERNKERNPLPGDNKLRCRIRAFLPTGGWFYPLIFILSVVLVGRLLLDYNTAWIHPEVTFRHLPYVAAEGPGLSWNDIPRIFNPWEFDEIVRARFLSYTFQVLGLQLRLLLYSLFPPSPGISLIGLLTLIVSPLVFYRLLKNLTDRRDAAWAGVVLYFLSTGFLSGVFLLFHPAKPLLNLLAVVCLYFASKVSAAPGNSLSKHYWLTLGVMLLAFFADESSLVVFLTVPVIFPAVLKVVKKPAASFGLYLLPLAAFQLTVTLIVPRLSRVYGYGDFNYWESVFLRSIYPVTARLPEKLWGTFRVGNFAANIVNLFRAQFTVPGSGCGRFFLSFCGGILLPLYCVVSFIRLTSKPRRVVVRCLGALLIFFAAETFIQGKHSIVLDSSYYYGSLFPVYFVPVLAILLANGMIFRSWLHRILVTILLIVFSVVFFQINRESRDSHEILPFSFPGKEVMLKEMGEGGLTWPMIRRAWGLRRDLVALFEIRPQFPRRAIWLFQELRYFR